MQGDDDDDDDGGGGDCIYGDLETAKDTAIVIAGAVHADCHVAVGVLLPPRGGGQ